jgi:hypothetical protein
MALAPRLALEADPAVVQIDRLQFVAFACSSFSCAELLVSASRFPPVLRT